jgi:hypothetical protein
MVNILFLGCHNKGLPIRALVDHGIGVVAIDHPMESGSEQLHSSVKSSDVVVVCGKTNDKSSHIVADDIWHLLRNRIMVSLNDSMTLAALRDLYPLSKVCRCSLYVDAEMERTLSLLSLDSSFSDADLTSMKEVFGRMGEFLVLKEEIFENLNRDMDLSLTVLAEVTRVLGESAEVDADLFEYALSWVLVSLGSAGIGGRVLLELLPQSPSLNEDARAQLRKNITKALANLKSKKQGG